MHTDQPAEEARDERVLDAAAVLDQIRTGEISTVIVGGCDVNGVFRAKRLPSRRFAARSEPFVEFSEYMWAMDIDDFPQPRPAGFTGSWPEWQSGFGDIEAVADLSTLRRVPWLDRTAVVLCDYRLPDKRAYDFAPRNVLRRVLERYEQLDLQPRLAPEFEFVVLRETEQSALEKGFRNLQPLAPRAMPYGASQGTIDNHLIGRIVDALLELRVPVEAWNPEGAPGQYELNIEHAPALEAADRGFLFKHGVKEICALAELTATFMPKLAPGYGSSLHVHQSVWRSGESVFHDSERADGMSPLLRHYVAGQLQTLIPFLPIWWPTPTAFKRGAPYSAAGTTVTWGGDNKTLSLRVLTHDAAHCRIEHRVPGADANVYLTFAALLAGGLYGIENELEPPPPTVGDAYANDDVTRLPTSLDSAIGTFEDSAVANEYLGEEFVQRYAATRRWELEQFQQDITDWELRRYFTRA